MCGVDGGLGGAVIGGGVETTGALGGLAGACPEPCACLPGRSKSSGWMPAGILLVTSRCPGFEKPGWPHLPFNSG